MGDNFFSSLQLLIQICDGGGKCNETEGTIIMSNNYFTPSLNQTEYTATILETVSFGLAIITVNGTDGDTGVCIFMLFYVIIILSSAA